MQTHVYHRAGLGPRLAACLALVLTLTLLPAAATPAAAQITGSVNFEDTIRQISTTGNKSIFPRAAIDTNNRTHIIWADSSAGALYYTNNINGSFTGPQQISGGIKDDSRPFAMIAIGANNVLHVVYSKTSDRTPQVYYKQGVLNGAFADWSDPQQISSGFKSFGANLALDKNGNIHVVWIDNRCGNTYNVYYRVRTPDGKLGAVTAPLPDCKYQAAPFVAVTNDGKVHTVFQRDTEIYYRWTSDGNTWQGINISESGNTNSANPSLTTDGTALYVAWGENIVPPGQGAANHNVQFRRSTNGGLNWSTRIDISGGPEYAQFPNTVWSEASNRVYIVYVDKAGAIDDFPDIYFREFDPPSALTGTPDRIQQRALDSAWPAIAVGSSRLDIVWQDRGGDSILKVYDNGGTIIGGSAACNGSLQLEGGATATNKATLSGVITPANGCQPDQMQITVDTPPTDATAKVSYDATPSIPIPTAAACTRTVYVRLFNNGVAGDIFRKSILVDREIDATVSATNPYMRGLPKTYSLQDTRDQQGASDGDTNFSRARTFMLMVSDAGDCSQIKTVKVNGGPAITVQNGSLSTAQALPGSPGPGAKDIAIQVTDGAGNVRTYNSDIVYDPANTSSNPATPNADGLPKLKAANQPTDQTGANTLIRQLRISGINVDDNLYGDVAGIGPQLPDDRQFWGIWVANSRTKITNPSTDDSAAARDLEWFPLKIDEPSTTIDFEWSLFSGLGYKPNDTSKTGDYYVYIRFLDGAGNPSVGFREIKITLNSGYKLPTAYTPIVRK